MLSAARQFLSALFLSALSAGAGAAEPRLDLLEFEVLGNTSLATLDIERALYPHLGPDKRMADLERARAALETAYHDAGYLSATVAIPEQRVGGGLVRLQVIEGEIERLRVTGNRYHARAEIRAEVPSLAPGQAPHFPSLQQELAALGRSPDLRVTPLLRPGRQPGRVEVELAVEDQLPLHGQVEFNNRQSPDTSEFRLEAGLRYDNLFQEGHSLGFNVVTAPQQTDEVNVFSVNYRLPLARSDSLMLSWQRSDSDIASALDSSVVGRGDILGLRYARQLPAVGGWPGFFHSLAAGFDFKDFDETQTALGAFSKQTPLRYAPLVMQYAFGRSGERTDWLGNLTLGAGLRGSARMVDCEGIPREQFDCRRRGARANFVLLRVDLTRTHRFAGWEWQLRLDAQASGQPLVPNEQFLAGGIDSVRGYLEGEAAGDYGARLRSELRTPPLPGVAGLRAAGFVEGALLALHDPLPGTAGEHRLAGAGVGLRYRVTRDFNLQADWARALRAGPSTARGDERAHFRIAYRF
jgi:hemolysin activation/secretion protein